MSEYGKGVRGRRMTVPFHPPTPWQGSAWGLVNEAERHYHAGWTGWRDGRCDEVYHGCACLPSSLTPSHRHGHPVRPEGGGRLGPRPPGNLHPQPVPDTGAGPDLDKKAGEPLSAIDCWQGTWGTWHPNLGLRGCRGGLDSWRKRHVSMSPIW